MTGTGDPRFEQAIGRIDAANAEDPRSELVDGHPQPRELLFARKVYDWVQKLAQEPSEALLLAARGHTVRRWAIPRSQYAMDNAGYHQWRAALATYHAGQTAAILRDVGYDADVVERVQAFIRRERFPQDAEARVLEDADCLAFLELKLHKYLDQWNEDKLLHILRATMAKMTPAAQEQAMKLPLGEAEMAVMRRAAGA